ncbi:MAG TPA: type II toxin-antitoxin system VapB family antitoxin [Candidatus Xenobia bacterium]
MGLHINNSETCRMVQELAQLTGESLTTAVEEAVRERLERVKRQQASRVDQLLALGRDCAPRLKELYRTADPGTFLYDDQGLPR